MTFYVLLHGFPDLPNIWEPLISSLPKDQKILTPNLWDLGTENGKPLSSEKVAAKIYFELRKQGFTKNDQLIVIGHDLGAAYATELARLVPEQTVLTLLNGLTPQMMLARMQSGTQILKSWYIWLIQLPLLPKGLLFLDKKLPSRLATLAHRPQAPSMCSKDDLVRGLQMYRKLFREGILLRKSNTKKIKKMIVVWGIQDPFLNSPVESEFTPLANDVEIHLLDNHHWPQLHSPEQVAHIIHANT